MSDQSDSSSDDGIKPWTIKGISPEVRNAAIEAAKRARQPIGEWVSRAIRSQVQADRQENRMPAVVRPEADPVSDLGELERLVALTTQLSSAGAAPPKSVSRGAYGLIRKRLAEMKGPTGTALGRTKGVSGPTEPDVSPTEQVSGPTKAENGPTKVTAGPTKTPPSQTKPISTLRKRESR